jgi:hypothetical protein
MSGKFWLLQSNFYSSREDLDKQRNQRLEQPNQDHHLAGEYILSSLYALLKDGVSHNVNFLMIGVVQAIT